MKALEKKLRSTIEEGKMAGEGMEPLARQILKSIKPVVKPVPSPVG